MPQPSVPIRVTRTITLCFFAALFEGLDIQSMGVAAPRLAPAFALGPDQLGVALSASVFGLMLGAAVGGTLSDRLGRRAVIVLSLLALGGFSLMTAVAGTFHNLLLIRVLAGLGLGGAFPTLIALVSQIATPRSRVTALACMYCGLPIGGMSAGLVAAQLSDWHDIFYVGGFGPLVLVPFLMGYLPNRIAEHGAAPKEAGRPPPGTFERLAHLFGPRATTTLLLWVAYFFTLLVVYLLLNWLPSLMSLRGYSHTQGAHFSIILNLGATLGSLLLGFAADRRRPATVLCVTYIGMIASLAALGSSLHGALALGAFAAGFFVIGGQLVLYAIAPTLYPTSISGTGVGAAVAVGRIGSIVGPLIGGHLLASGFGPKVVPAAAVPGLVIALLSLLWLLRLTSIGKAN